MSIKDILRHIGDITLDREGFNGTSIGSINDFIESISKAVFKVTEALINKYAKEYAPDYEIRLRNEYFELKSLNFEAKLSYYSYDFRGAARAITFKLLDLKPFRYNLFLGLINRQVPFLEYRKSAEKERLITCHLNRISQLKDNRIIKSTYIQYVAIEYVKCEPGIVTIKLKTKPDLFLANLKDTLSHSK